MIKKAQTDEVSHKVYESRKLDGGTRCAYSVCFQQQNSSQLLKRGDQTFRITHRHDGGKIFFSQMCDTGLKSEWPNEEKGKDKKNEASVRK